MRIIMVGNEIHYTLENVDKKNFSPIQLNNQYVLEAFNFAMNMTFNKNGEHREYRTGGTKIRKNGEIFANAFQGKMAEFAVYDMLKNKFKLTPTYPDIETYDRGIWDVMDISVNGLNISIKSTKTYGNLLLLEAGDYDEKGNYKPNQIAYDLYILTRIGRVQDNKSAEDILKQNRWLYSNFLEKEENETIQKEFVGKNWEYDIPGFINKHDFLKIIHRLKITGGENIKNGFIPKGAILNTYTNMDADNYFCVANYLRDIESLND